MNRAGKGSHRYVCLPPGGMRLSDMPGVKHSESVLKAGRGMHPHTGKPYRKPPANTVSTAQDAELLGILPSSARARLRRRKVREFYVQLPVGSITAYWQKKKVLELVKQQAAVHRGAPHGMVGWRQAVKLLGRARTTLQRHARKGRVRTLRVRQAAGRGMRTVCYFNAADLKRLAGYLRLCRAQELARRKCAAQNS